MAIGLIDVIHLAKTGVVIPAAISSFWLMAPLHDSAPSKSRDAAEIELVSYEGKFALQTEDEEFQTNSRRGRVEQILSDLNRVAEISLQMSPERASQLEPVILDLAERAMELSAKEVVLKTSTAHDLDEIEATVKRLGLAVARSIGPDVEL